MLTIGASLHLPSVFLSLFSWSSFYFGLRKLEPQRKAEWHCRVITAIHATLITFITAWAGFVQGPWPFTDAGGPNTPLQVTATTVCLGYFLFDFAWCLYFQTEGLVMLLHHSLSIFGFVWMLFAGKYGTELMATLCGSEVTNPLLQLRWFLKETGRYETLLGEVVDVLFMLSFFAIRLGIGTVLIYCYFQQPTDFMGRFGAVAIYLISWMFGINIFQYAVYKYTRKRRAKRRAPQNQTPSSPVANGSTSDEKRDVKDNASVDEVEKFGESSYLDENNFDAVDHSQGLSSGLSQNGLHHRSGAQVVDSRETSSVNGTMTDSGVTSGVLIHD